MSSNLSSLYNHAFVVGPLPTTYTRISLQGIDHHVRLTTVLIFNIALTCHQKGLLDGPMSLEILRKAIHRYQLVCMRMSLLSSPGAMEDLYVIQLVSWNNMGHIYSHLTEKEDAIRCRALLHQALFEDAALSLGSMHGYPYASFYLFVVCTEVRRRGFKALSLSRGLSVSKSRIFLFCPFDYSSRVLQRGSAYIYTEYYAQRFCFLLPAHFSFSLNYKLI
jgi:hypothetical protein